MSHAAGATGPHRGPSRSPPAASPSRSCIVGGRCATCSCMPSGDLAVAAYAVAMELVLVLVVLGGLTAVAVAAGKSGQKRELARVEAEVAPVKRLAEEDVTALGVELQDLDIDLAGEELHAALVEHIR